MFTEGWSEGFPPQHHCSYSEAQGDRKSSLWTVVVAGTERKEGYEAWLCLKALLWSYTQHVPQFNGRSKSRWTSCGQEVQPTMYWKWRGLKYVWTAKLTSWKGFPIEIEVTELTDANFTKKVRRFFKVMQLESPNSRSKKKMLCKLEKKSAHNLKE